MFGMLLKAVLIVISGIWIIYYFKELPKNIRELKESKQEYLSCKNPAISEKFKSEEKRTKNQEYYNQMYKSNLVLIFVFSGITVFAGIYLIRSLVGLTMNIVRAF